MKYVRRIKILNGFLNVIGTMMILIFIGYFYYIFSGDIKVDNFLFHVAIRMIFLGGHILIITILRRILNSIRDNDPFNSDNVLGFRKIGYYILMSGFAYTIATYPDPNNSGLTIIGTSYGSVKPISFLYLILSILSFILSDVFRMAMEIKDENDLTI